MEAESNSQHQEALISSFCEIASGSKEEARFFLESHNWDLDAAVSTFLDDATAVAEAPAGDQPIIPTASRSPSSEYAPSRSRSPSPAAPSLGRAYDLRSRREKPSSGSRIRTLADLNRPADDDSDSEADEPQEYYTGGEKSGMLVQDPTRGNDADSIFNQAKQSGRVVKPESIPSSSSSSRSFTGNARLLTGETVLATPAAPQPPSAVTHTITLWRNGFSVNGGPLRRPDDPANTPFLESIRRSECPQELAPANIRTPVHIKLEKTEEDYHEPVMPKETFQGTGRTLGGGNGSGGSATDGGRASFSAPVPTMGLVVDDSLPSTALQLRLADGTRMVSRFNHHHTIRDVRSFIDASRPDGPRSYQLQMMGFPPKVLGDFDQMIDEAGVANSVVIQKL